MEVSTASRGVRARAASAGSAKRANCEDASSASCNVKVCARFRPFNTFEQSSKSCVSFGDDGKSVRAGSNSFVFDKVFQEEATQKDVYEFCAQPLVSDCLQGYNCTIFAYGQTGSGKTHTMTGAMSQSGEVSPLERENDLHGIIPRIAEDIFVAMRNSDRGTEFIVKVSFVEIYMERIRDLLDPKSLNLRIREDKTKGVSIEGAQEVYVASAKELLKVVAKGAAARAIASTRMNQDSSRSHSVFNITVNQRNEETSVSKTGKLFLVDLAGSEMVKKTGAYAETLKEAQMINKSLSALGNVIMHLVDGSEHVPYRDSKLTRCLQDSLGGNSKTSLIVTCSTASFNENETLSTLRFGKRAKKIKNKPKINQEYSIAEYKIMLARAKETVRELGLYARSLEKRVGISDNESPIGKASYQRTVGQTEMKDSMRASSEDQKSLLSRAEEALTVALETSESLKAKLEDTRGELRITKEALEGARNSEACFEDRLTELSKDNAELTRSNSTLQHGQQQLEFKVKELELIVESLREERDLLQSSLEESWGGMQLLEKKKLQQRQAPESSETSQEDLLKNDVQVITDKYIQLRLENLELQEVLAASENNDVRNLQDSLQRERDKSARLEAQLRAEKTQRQLAVRNEGTAMLKLANREEQIQFLEAAVNDYQGTFKSHVKNYQSQLDVLHKELNHYRMAFNEIEQDEESTTSDTAEEEAKLDKVFMITPRVAKPVRGGGEGKGEMILDSGGTFQDEMGFEESGKTFTRSTAKWLMNRLGGKF